MQTYLLVAFTKQLGQKPDLPSVPEEDMVCDRVDAAWKQHISNCILITLTLIHSF